MKSPYRSPATPIPVVEQKPEVIGYRETNDMVCLRCAERHSIIKKGYRGDLDAFEMKCMDCQFTFLMESRNRYLQRKNREKKVPDLSEPTKSDPLMIAIGYVVFAMAVVGLIIWLFGRC